ncbi:MAG: ATP-binding cassette domain-containing protein [Pseudomonadota bacterium]
MKRAITRFKRQAILRRLAPFAERQMSKNDCGISVLQSVLRLYGQPLPRHRIRDDILLDEEGSRFEELRAYLGKKGVGARYQVLELAELSAETLQRAVPCIAMVQASQYKHYVFVHSVVGDEVILMDPAVGEFRCEPLAQFCARLARVSTTTDESVAYAYITATVEQSMRRHGLEMVPQMPRDQLVSHYNKLQYFDWITEKLPGADESDGRRLLTELLACEDDSIVPSRFKTFRFRPTELMLKSPVVLSLVDAPSTVNETKPPLQTGVPKLLSKVLGVPAIRHDIRYFIGIGVTAWMISMLVVYTNQILIDEVIPTRELGSLYVFVSCLLFIRAFELGQQVVKSLFEIRIGQSLDKWLLDGYNKSILQIPSETISNYSRGELGQRINDALRIKGVIAAYINDYLFSIFVVVVAVLLALRTYQSAALVIIGVAAVYYYLLKKTTAYIRYLEAARFTKKGEMLTTHMNVVEGHPTIKKNRLEQRFFETQQDGLREYLAVQQQSQIASQLLGYIPRFLAICGSLLIILMATRAHVLHNELSIGQIFTLVALAEMAFVALRSMLKTQLNLQEQAVVIDRFFDLAELPSATVASDACPQIATVELQDVHYSYAGRGFQLSVPHLSLNAGDRVLLEGGNGAGKSTLLKVLSGLLQKGVNGDISFYQKDGSPVNRNDGYTRVALIRAEDKIFNETLQFNVVFHNSRRTPDIYRYARLIGADDFINPNRLAVDSLIHDNGANLSTGQRRKLLILRALLSESDVVIFDEIFRGVDADSKNKIIHTLNHYADDKIIIYTSHEPVDGLRLNRRLLLSAGRLTESCAEKASLVVA